MWAAMPWHVPAWARDMQTRAPMAPPRVITVRQHGLLFGRGVTTTGQLFC